MTAVLYIVAVILVAHWAIEEESWFATVIFVALILAGALSAVGVL